MGIHMRKAQVEIIGLLIIVLIISVVMIFALKNLLEPADDHRTQYTYKDISAGFVGAVLQTSSQCTSDLDFARLIIDCAKFPPDGSLICDNGQQSCDFAHDAIGNILEQTIGVWKYPYEFQVRAPSGQVIRELDFNSTGLKYTGQTTTFPQPLTIDTSGYATIFIMLCMGGPCPTE